LFALPHIGETALAAHIGARLSVDYLPVALSLHLPTTDNPLRLTDETRLD
jgi:hypothetical protein